MLKLLLIVIINGIFLPLYVCFFVVGFFVTFLPLFPVVTAQKNVRERLLLTGIKNRFFVTMVTMQYVFYFFEITIFDSLRLTHASLRKNFRMEDFLTEVRKSFPDTVPTGFTYLAGHVANLEFHTLPIIKANRILGKGSVVGLAKPSRSKFINKILTWHRVRPGVGMIWTDKNLFENMHIAVDRGDSLCLVADQKPKKNGVFIKFFGKFAAFPTTGVKFCAEKKSIFIYAFANRILPGWVRVHYECGKNFHLNQERALNSLSPYVNTKNMLPSEVYTAQNEEDSVAENENAKLEMAYFAKWLEDQIKIFPTQWCWDYRKWSRDPE